MTRFTLNLRRPLSPIYMSRHAFRSAHLTLLIPTQRHIHPSLARTIANRRCTIRAAISQRKTSPRTSKHAASQPASHKDVGRSTSSRNTK